MNGYHVSLEDLGMAYRKAKVDMYYAGNPCWLQLQAYEESLLQNLQQLKDKLGSTDSVWAEDKSFIGDWTLVAKGFGDFKKKNGDVFSDPEIQWDICCQQAKPDAEFRLMAQPSIDFVVLSTLWIMKVGHKYDEKLKDCSYGNRLRRKKNGGINLYSLGTFSPYQQSFRNWRDNGIRAMKAGLDEGKQIVSITGDVSSFYHELDSDFLLNGSFLKTIGLELSDDDRKLTELFLQALKAWADNTPLKTGLPVGLPASAVVANMALVELDRIIQEQVNPLYYGRYVDDIILVMENPSDFKDSEKVWEWVFSRSDGLLKWGKQNEEVLFAPDYLHSSRICFANKKNKVFFLQGSTGRTLVDSLARQIEERASEWRALPNLSGNPDEIATDLISATQGDGEAADNLRKADSLSMTRSKFAMKLRDFEAYERDLPPEAWEQHRKAFFKAYIEHTLVLPVYFDLEKYLPRVLRLAVACEDFAELKEMIEKVLKLVEQVKGDCNPTIKSCKEDYSTDNIIEKWQSYIHQVVEESLKAAFPARLSAEGKRLWRELFPNDGTVLSFDVSVKTLQAAHTSLFNHDLATLPFRFIGLPDFLVERRRIPAKKAVTYLKDSEQIVSASIVTGLEHVCREGRLYKKDAGIPYGFLFATRPFNLTELFILFKNPYASAKAISISESILALRGFSSKDKMPMLHNNVLELFSSKKANKKKVVVTCWATNDKSWIASVTKRADPCALNRYQRINDLFNDVLKCKTRPDYLILPELALPAGWFIRFAQKLHGNGIALISGVEYLHRRGKKVSNQVWLALPHDGLGFPSIMIYRQDKQRPALGEEKSLQQLAGLKLVPETRWSVPPVIRQGQFQFAMLVCSELTNIAYRSALRGKVDALFVPEWNKDTASFNALVESAALDIHAYIVQCNDRKYGDSRIRAPYKEAWQRDIIRLKGGVNDYFVVGEIDVEELRKFQSSHRSPDKPFKPVPDGFDIAYERKTLPKV